jgi:hypothetical protein
VAVGVGGGVPPGCGSSPINGVGVAKLADLAASRAATAMGRANDAAAANAEPTSLRTRVTPGCEGFQNVVRNTNRSGGADAVCARSHTPQFLRMRSTLRPTRTSLPTSLTKAFSLAFQVASVRWSNARWSDAPLSTNKAAADVG